MTMRTRPAEVAKAASVVAAKEVKTAGLSDAAAEAIRQKILGVAA